MPLPILANASDHNFPLQFVHTDNIFSVAIPSIDPVGALFQVVPHSPSPTRLVALHSQFIDLLDEQKVLEKLLQTPKEIILCFGM